MKRSIIEIDQDKCNGCGAYIPNCPEGALQMIDGKARLVSDLFCDGLGACIGECPRGAIKVVEREAVPYDERAVMENIITQGPNTIKAHLKHLKDHGEHKLLDIAQAVLRAKQIPVPLFELPATLPCGCPGSLAKRLEPTTTTSAAKPTPSASALRQWPVQLALLNPDAEYFADADLLISADCVAHAYGAFHSDLLAGKILIVFCPKLDQDLDRYVDKLAAIFSRHQIRSVTVARMTVPCCGGTVAIVQKAIQRSGASLQPEIRIIDIDGTPKS